LGIIPSVVPSLKNIFIYCVSLEKRKKKNSTNLAAAVASACAAAKAAYLDKKKKSLELIGFLTSYFINSQWIFA